MTRHRGPAAGSPVADPAGGSTWPPVDRSLRPLDLRTLRLPLLLPPAARRGRGTAPTKHLEGKEATGACSAARVTTASSTALLSFYLLYQRYQIVKNGK